MEILLGVVILGLLGEIAYLTASHKAEVERLTKAVIAKNLTQLDTSTIIDREKPKKEEEIEPDIIPLEEADSKLFIKAISNK